MKKKYPSRYANIELNYENGGSLSRFIPANLFMKVNKRLSAVNQRSLYENQAETLKVIILLAVFGVLYFLLSFILFHDLWYHVLICAFATAVFLYVQLENYFEALENKVKYELPNICDKISHYYDHLDGNLLHVLKKTEERVSSNSRVYISRIKDALSSDNYEIELMKVKNSMPIMWLKILCMIILFAKRNGGTIYDESNRKQNRNIMAEVLEVYSIIIDFNNLQQGYIDAEMKGYENLLLYAPFATVIVVKGYYKYFSKYIDVISVYDGIEAKSLVALLFFFSSAGALFLHWLRSNQN